MNIKGPIIIVEDDGEDREILQEIFTELQTPNRLLFFKEGGEVLQYLITTQDRPFMIITDVTLPGMNGLELRQAIMNNPVLHQKNIPFIFLSTSDGKALMDRMAALQIQGYFQKPTSYPKIREQIKLIVAYWSACKTWES